MQKNLNKQEDTFDKLVRPYNKALAKAVFEKLDKEIMEEWINGLKENPYIWLTQSADDFKNNVITVSTYSVQNK